MKISNAKKIIVSSLAIAMGAGLAGSVSGSVAWYQYSTRTSANIAGTSAGTVRELLVSKTADGTFSQHVSYNAENEKLFKPTSVSVANNALTFYDHPVYKTAELPALAQNELSAYVHTYTFFFKCNDQVNGAAAAQQVKDVYLTYINIVDVNGANDSLNIAPAVRIAINGEILSKAGGTTTTSSKLDLNNNEEDDKDGYDTNDVEGDDITYINGTSASYTSTAVANSTTVVNSNDPYEFVPAQGKQLSEVKLTTTKADGASDPVTIQVWLEGWQELGGKTLWDSEWLSQNFEIQLQFACEADR